MDLGQKDNVCPICSRTFPKLSGLRQHITKSHKVEEINELIAQNTQRSQSTQQPYPQRPFTSQLQVITVDPDSSQGNCFHRFDIIENGGSGDCLFLATLEYMQRQNHLFPNTPKDVYDLRSSTVNFIALSSNFGRFKDSIKTNLCGHIQALQGNTVTSEESLKNEYVKYMSAPGVYGTAAELCAMAETFNFSFYVVRKDNDNNYSCYDYGSMENFANHRTNAVVFLLFTGPVGNGHFRLLLPDDLTTLPAIPMGAYERVDDFTTSRMLSICPTTSVPNLNIEAPRDHDLISESEFEDFIILLARCKRNIRVLKRVPRGARIAAANKLSRCIDECLVSPKLSTNWKDLLMFAYTSLRVPDKTKITSLSALVKKNIEKPELIFPSHRKKFTPISISKRVEYKIADGDVKGAVRILSSSDTLATQSISTFEQLKLKHPPPARTMKFPDPPDKNTEPLVVTEKDTFYSIKSFPNGSGSGIDGLLPQHLKDLTLPSTGESGLRLLKSITALSNHMLSGGVNSEFIKIMYGASLCALDKKEGGIRPIAVGNTFRRMTSKLACASVRDQMASKFAPRQVGFGVKGGCEAAVHATRTFIKKNSHKKTVIVKIDFNEVDRDIFLNEMRLNCPAIYPFLWQCYSSPTLLFYGDFILLSQNGAQQGDPCGPLVFSSAIQFIIDALVSEFVIFYLDDGTIAGEYADVLRDFETVKVECGKIGLQINPAKCELYFCSEVDQPTVVKFNELSPGICVVNDFTLLGTAITDSAFDYVFQKKLTELRLLFSRLVDLDNYHIAFYVLKNCFAMPKLIFLLRTTPTWNHEVTVVEIDELIKSTLETLTNCNLSNDTWTLASLPINCGGTGIPRVQDTALPAFLSSVNAVHPLVSTMLTLPTLTVGEIGGYRDSLDMWNRWIPDQNLPESPCLQKQWSAIMVNRLSNSLEFEHEEDRARLLAVRKSESGAWLHALPSRAIGTLLENNAFRIIMGLRLGIDICSPHVCLCGSQVDKKGHHGLKCRKSAGRHARHSELNNIIKRALVSADVPAVLEPTGLARGDGKRVDGMSLIPWSKGCTLVWDATCTDTFAPSNLRFSAKQAGGAAEDKAKQKARKYGDLINQNYCFVAFAVETMGPWCTEANRFFDELSKMIMLKTNEPRSKSFLKQRLSMAIQRGNAAAIMGTFRGCDKMSEVFYLL